MQIICSKAQLPRWTRFLMPVGIFLLMSYGTWAFSHKLCYNQIYKHYGHRSVSIGLIVVVCFLQLTLLLIWFQIAITVGPGRLPQVLPNLILSAHNSDRDANEKYCNKDSFGPVICYQCDPNGYPIWCTNCQSLKTERAHHSSELGYCVPKFDHKCVWLGSIIGKDNYRLFVQYCVFMAIWLAIIWTSIVAYIRSISRDYRGHGSHLNGNLISTLILTASSWLMVTSLLLTQINCIVKNNTSLEIMERRKTFATRRMFCYYNPNDECRYVVELSKKEYLLCWSKESWWANAVESLGPNILMWAIPWGSPVPKFKSGGEENVTDDKSTLEDVLGPYKETLGNKTVELIRKKINNNEYLTRFQVYSHE
ncbi:palmitoyltransferase pfa5 [Zygosaccharomyces mellis]|uniref:Palmitoyltransferase n=1 Tax=Zygosaccharomyces mellis TaxID=42258 RepID=A0A4C2E2F0_9SACH|nr:palmitoyltransferase pfa5 [Zygosaccharomyces mellis]